MATSTLVRTDCVYFKGEKPCLFKRICDRCSHFKPFGSEILIIKCRAQGDVLRTTPLLTGLKRRYPGSFITWVVDEESVDLLRDNPLIDRVMPLNLETSLALQAQRFDAVYSLDKDPGLTSLASLVSSPRKFGFGLNEHGNLAALDPAAAHALRLGVDDELKFRVNTKTYQEMTFAAVGLEYENDDYVFTLKEEHRAKAEAFWAKRRVPKGRPTIGLNTGSGTKFTTKQWPRAHFLKLITLLRKRLRANVFILGGPREKAFNAELVRRSPVKVYDPGTANSLLEFAGFLSMMDAVVSSDTLAMHLGLALKKKVVVLFGSTSPAEIELYGRGRKLFAGAACAPCYKQACPDLICMKSITPDQVLAAVEEVLAS
jgi:heptosyltransferase-2